MEQKIVLLEDFVNAPKSIRIARDSSCKRVYSDDTFYVYLTPINSYEVFYRKLKPVVVLNKETGFPTKVEGEMKEAYPKDEDFGSWAWSFPNKKCVVEFLAAKGKKITEEDIF